MRIAFLIDSLGRAGAEIQLLQTAEGFRARGHEVFIITLRRGGDLLHDAISKGIPVRCVGRGIPSLFRLRCFLRSSKCQVAYGFLPASCWRLSIAMVGVRQVVTVWGVRSSAIDWSLYGWKPRVVSFVASKLSALPDIIIANSERGRRDHIASGYATKSFVVIPNGVDLEKFSFNQHNRETLRREWGFSEKDFVVAILARFDPIKGHDSFCRVARGLVKQEENIKVVAAGGGSSELRNRFVQAMSEFMSPGDVLVLDHISDTTGFYGAVDVLVVSSSSEAFPNVAVEAMACGTPVVGFDVGDLSVITSTPGGVVPVSDEEGLVSQIREVRKSKHVENGRALQRAHVENHFSVEKALVSLEETLESYLC